MTVVKTTSVSELVADVSASLTILLHGGVTSGNIEAVLQSIAMWRSAYPFARLHFCASTLGEEISDCALALRPESEIAARDNHREQLGTRIATHVDYFSTAPYQPALATLKYDSGPNNCNRMIASARTGLTDVHTRFVLRCRHDLFIDDITACLADYAMLAKQDVTPDLFEWPVAVSPYFTLNPLLLEHLPYHVSDWFHFGLTTDLRTLWNVDYFSARDAQYYQMYPHAHHSGDIERLFRARLSPEQYIFNACAVRSGYPELSFHNEPGHEDCFFDLLRRNFVIVNHRAVGMTFPKYDRVKAWIQSDYQSIGHDQWVSLVRLGVRRWRQRLWMKRIVVYYFRNLRPRLLYRKWKQSRGMRTMWWLR